MHLSINHTTSYRFSAPQRRLIQRLRLTPPTCSSQQIISWDINVGCDARLMPAFDGFGNESAMLYVDGPVDHLHLIVTGEVLTENHNGVVAGIVEPLPPLAYLRPTRLTQATPEIVDFAREMAARETDPLARIHALMVALFDRMTFESDESRMHMDAGEAFADKRGVCQDYSHILIAAARALDIPARYVSGHLFRRDTSAHQPATHGWAEAHIEGLGWVGFDAANCMCPDDAYVRVAWGLDYRDAAPIAGARLGGGSESLIVDVVVTQSQAQSQLQS